MSINIKTSPVIGSLDLDTSSIEISSGALSLECDQPFRVSFEYSLSFTVTALQTLVDKHRIIIKAASAVVIKRTHRQRACCGGSNGRWVRVVGDVPVALGAATTVDVVNRTSSTATRRRINC